MNNLQENQFQQNLLKDQGILFEFVHIFVNIKFVCSWIKICMPCAVCMALWSILKRRVNWWPWIFQSKHGVMKNAALRREMVLAFILTGQEQQGSKNILFICWRNWTNLFFFYSMRGCLQENSILRNIYYMIHIF